MARWPLSSQEARVVAFAEGQHQAAKRARTHTHGSATFSPEGAKGREQEASPTRRVAAVTLNGQSGTFASFRTEGQ